MSKPSKLNEAEQAELREIFSQFGVVNGIGLTKNKEGNFDEPNIIMYFEKIFRHTKKADIPTTYKGYSVKYQRLGKIRPT